MTGTEGLMGSCSPDVERLRRAGIVTFCREREEHGAWCGKTAEFIIWGRLFPASSLGPRCYDHAAAHVGHRILGDNASAIADLRPLLDALGVNRVSD